MERSGTTFEHDKEIKEGRRAAEAHEMLDPKRANNNGPHTGDIMREAYDNDDHPESTPVAVFFDVTGSMGQMPYELQAKLPALFDLLEGQGFISDPQLMFGAISDELDAVPLQVSQFESDNTAQEHLENIYVTHGGAGPTNYERERTGFPEEAYDLAMYFMANHTDLDCLNKRDKKGYLFFLADEAVRPAINPEIARKVMGDTIKIEDGIKTEDIAKMLIDKYEVFVLFCEHGGPYTLSQAGSTWTNLFGSDRVISLGETGSASEVIAGMIAMHEGRSADEVLDALKDASSDETAIEQAGKVMAAATTVTAEGDDDAVERL